jgi:type II secretory pathway pseudopilin PulG
MLALAGLLMVGHLAAGVDITAFGAVRDDKSNAAAVLNAQALYSAFQNASNNIHDKTVVIPSGDWYTFATPAIVNISNVVLRIDGRWIASNNISAWPKDSDNKSLPIFEFDYCDYLQFEGQGYVMGQGTYHMLRWQLVPPFPLVSYLETILYSDLLMHRLRLVVAYYPQRH